MKPMDGPEEPGAAAPAMEDGGANSAPAADSAVDLDDCLDALAQALRHWGRLAIQCGQETTRETTEQFEAWARHVLIAAPPPIETSVEPPARSWPQLAHFVREQRSGERDRVHAHIQEMQEVIWTFVESFSKAVRADRRGDARVRSRLEALRDAARSEDTRKLREEANAAMTVIEGAIDVREARYRTQIEVLSTRVEQLSSQLVEARRKGESDDLTGAHNRGALEHYLNKVTQLGEVIGSYAVLYLIDVDHFKWVNDKFGHAAGDEVLRKVVEQIGSVLRRSDDFIGRYGGDEFVVVAQYHSHEDAVEIGERLLFAVHEAQVRHEGETIRVSASIGAARLEPGDDPKSWIERADRAMYEAKRSGRRRVIVGVEDKEGGSATAEAAAPAATGR